ncbi:hypothetical protein TNCV_546531 [Trichonephila clavipes]|nr:hypothetical protein TNCV_546531 [Trichonephila clavipes]
MSSHQSGEGKNNRDYGNQVVISVSSVPAGRSDLVIRMCWEQMMTEGMSVTQRPGSGRREHTNTREAHDNPGAYYVHSRRPPSSRSSPLFGVVLCCKRLDCNRKESVIFSEKSKFSLGSDDNSVRVCRPSAEYLNFALVVQCYTVPTPGVMVWCAIVYNTRLPLTSIHGTIAAQS